MRGVATVEVCNQVESSGSTNGQMIKAKDISNPSNDPNSNQKCCLCYGENIVKQCKEGCISLLECDQPTQILFGERKEERTKK